MNRTKLAIGLAATYFVLAIVANAWLLGDSLHFAKLDARAFDYGWELGLPFRASHGEWVGRDFDYPIGPLWQLTAFASTRLFGEFEPARALTALHIVFPLLSLGLSWLLARDLFVEDRKRLLAFVGLAIFALHDDVRTARSWVSLAILLCFVPTERRGSRAVAAGLLVGGGALLSFETGLIGLVTLLTVTVARSLWPEERRPAARAFGRALGAVALALFVCLGLWRLGGGDFFRALGGFLQVTRSYAVVMVEGRHGLGLGPLVLFLGLTAILGGFLARARDSVALSWLVGALPLGLRALIRSDAEHVYAAVSPLAAVIVLVGVRHVWSGRPALAAGAAVLASGFALGWIGSRPDTPTAWKPRALIAWLSPPAERPRVVDNDLVRTVAHARTMAHAGCIVLPERLSVAHALAQVPGPTETLLRWTPAMKQALAARVVQQDCDHAVRQVVAFDVPAPYQALAFGEDFVALSQRYRLSHRLGPATFALRRRARPVTVESQALRVDGLGIPLRVSVPGTAQLHFGGQRLLPEQILRIRQRFEVPAWSWLLGGTPDVRVTFFDGDEPLGPGTLLTDRDVNREVTSFVPVHPEIAEWRWVAEHHAAVERRATRMVLEFLPRRFSPSSMRVTIGSVDLLSPPPIAAGERLECQAEIALLDASREASRFARHTPAAFAAQSLALTPNPLGQPPAEMFFEATPCPGSCFTARVRASAGAARFEFHTIRGASRPRLLDMTIREGQDRFVEVPIGDSAEQPMLLRVGAWPVEGSSAGLLEVLSPKVAPCPRIPSVAARLSSGQYQTVRGEVVVDGNAVRLRPSHHGDPPTELRVPVNVVAGTCVAFDLGFEGPSDTPAVAVEVSVFLPPISVRLAREVFGAEGVSHRFSHIGLDEFRGKDVALRLAAWTLGMGQSQRTGVVSNLRLHACDEPRVK